MQKEGIVARVCANLPELVEAIGPDAGALLLAEEALRDTSPAALLEKLATQEPWSDLPILLLTYDINSQRRSPDVFGKLSGIASFALLERPFRTATLDHIQCGHLDCTPEQRTLGVNLGLYSITYNNDSVLDREALQEYKDFRIEAEQKGFRHSLEVFDPNRPEAVEASKIPEFINDAIVRTLGGVTERGRPLFLKMVYHGPKAMEELVHYDPHLVVGF